jgi:hypothetical protein
VGLPADPVLGRGGGVRFVDLGSDIKVYIN